MKRLLVIILAAFLAFGISTCDFERVALLYSDSATKDGFYIGINKTANCCFVGGYGCTKYTENLEITIPDDYNGIPIKRIGGYYGRGVPTPFSISLADLYMNAPEGSDYNTVLCGDINKFKISEQHTVEDVVFNLNIGKNIESIEYVSMDKYYPHINEDGSIVFYHAVVNIDCSEKNKHFYSKDGKFYSKKNDELITDFDYVTNEHKS